MCFRSLVIVIAMGVFVPLSHAEEAGSEEPDWLVPTVGPLTPSAHLNAAIGDSSGDPEELALGHHDPTREDGTVQSIEAGLSLRAGPLEGFAVHAFTYGNEEQWDNEWEEAFLKQGQAQEMSSLHRRGPHRQSRSAIN